MKWLNSINIYNFLCVYMPLLYIYKSPVPGVDWGTALVMLCALSFLSGQRQRGSGMSSALIVILVYSVLCTIVNFAVGTTNYSSDTSIITRTGRFVVVMVTMMGFGYSSKFEPMKYLKLLRGLSLFVAGYAMLQALVYRLVGVKLINVIGGTNGDLALSSALGEYETMYRPPSIFIEPSHACYFLVPYLCYVLFCDPSTNDKINKMRFREAIFISLGMLFTTSGQGLTVLAVCWGFWFIRSAKNLNIRSFLISTILFVYLLYNFDFSSTINRVTTTENMNAVEARQGGYLLFDTLSGTYKVFGTGYGNYNDSVYYSSFAEIMFCTGYIGLVLVMLLFLGPLRKGSIFQKVLAVSCVLLMSGGGIYTASYLCLYIPLLVYRDWKNVNFEPKAIIKNLF